MKLFHCACAFFFICVALPCAARPQEKPLTKDQVLGLVKNQLGDETGAEAIRKRGIDFQPAEDFLDALRNAGATAAFIEAVQKARPSPTKTGKPESQLDIFAVFHLLLNEVSGKRIAQLVKERGLFERARPEEISALKDLGAPEEVLDAVRTTTSVVELDSDSEKLSEISKKFIVPHAELAEKDYRARLRQQPHSRTLMYMLAHALEWQGKKSEAAAVCRRWASLYPDDAFAYKTLAFVLISPLPYFGGDVGYDAESFSAFQMAARLDPKDAELHEYMAEELEFKAGELDENDAAQAERDKKAAEEEYCKAAALDPKSYAGLCRTRHNN